MVPRRARAGAGGLQGCLADKKQKRGTLAGCERGSVWVASFTEETHASSVDLSTRANGSNAKSMAPTSAESSESEAEVAADGVDLV